MVFFHMRYEE